MSRDEIWETLYQEAKQVLRPREVSRVYSSNSRRTRTAGLFTLRRVIFP